MRRIIRVTLVGVVLSVAPGVVGCAEEEGLHCCIMRRVCERCRCDEVESRIVESENEEACRIFLESSDGWGCYEFRELDALALCV